jgi:hypothetical protein
MTNHPFSSLEAFQQTLASVQLHFKVLLKPTMAETGIVDELSSLAIQS